MHVGMTCHSEISFQILRHVMCILLVPFITCAIPHEILVTSIIFNRPCVTLPVEEKLQRRKKEACGDLQTCTIVYVHK